MLYYKKFDHPSSREWVVFVHGAGGSSSIWFKQLKDYRKHFNILLVDLRGHGKSGELFEAYLQNDYTFKSIAKDIVDVLDFLRIQTAHFVGISLGTILIRTVAEMDATRVKSMILGGAVTRLDVRSRILVFTGNSLKRILPFMWLYRLFAWIIMPKRRHAESRTVFINEAKKLYRREVLRWFKLVNELNPILKYFNEKELPIPVLYLMGSEDYIFLAPVRQIIKKHKNAILKVIERAGHVCNVDQPELFNRESIGFIQTCSAST